MLELTPKRNEILTITRIVADLDIIIVSMYHLSDKDYHKRITQIVVGHENDFNGKYRIRVTLEDKKAGVFYLKEGLTTLLTAAAAYDVKIKIVGDLSK